MQELITQSLNTLKELPKAIQALLILAVLAGVTIYGYYQFNAPSAEIGKVINGDINQTGTQTGENNTNNNSISF